MKRKLLGNSAVVNGWRLLRLAWEDAARVGPGRFVNLALPEQAVSLPVHYVSEQAWLALLAPPCLAPALSHLSPGAELAATLAEGPGFEPIEHEALEKAAAPLVLVGSDLGVPAVLFLAEQLPADPHLVLLGGAEPPPFRPVPSTFMLEGLPSHAIAAAPALEAGGIPSRIASTQDRPGCFEGSVVELLSIWLASQPRRTFTIFACADEREIARLREVAAAGEHVLRAVVSP